jgi:hypothetical protein
MSASRTTSHDGSGSGVISEDGQLICAVVYEYVQFVQVAYTSTCTSTRSTSATLLLGATGTSCD